MKLLLCFGIGEKPLLSAGRTTVGLVQEVKTCWWLKVNRKPVRAHALDGASFPHIIRFTYRAEGREYTGSRCVSWAAGCPVAGEEITVYYDAARPERYAVRI